MQDMLFSLHAATIPPTYICVRAVVWECGEGHTDRHTDGRDQYTFRFGYASCEMQ